jgi:hypothetical protein
MRRTFFAYAAIAAACGGGLFAQTKPVFTENFESGKIDPAVWDVRTMGTATITVEPVEGAHGKYALHAHYPEGARGSYAMAVATHLPDSVQKHVFGRAYMKITGTLPPTHNPLIITGEPGWQLSKFYEIGTSRAHWMPSFQENKSTQGQGRGEVTYRSEVSPPFEKWFLLEWEINDDPASQTLWVDGEVVPNMMGTEKVDTVTYKWPKDSATNSNLVGGFKEFGFGARCWGAPMTGFDVYYDDIAIGTSRIGK